MKKALKGIAEILLACLIFFSGYLSSNFINNNVKPYLAKFGIINPESIKRDPDFLENEISKLTTQNLKLENTIQALEADNKVLLEINKNYIEEQREKEALRNKILAQRKIAQEVFSSVIADYIKGQGNYVEISETEKTLTYSTVGFGRLTEMYKTIGLKVNYKPIIGIDASKINISEIKYADENSLDGYVDIKITGNELDILSLFNPDKPPEFILAYDREENWVPNWLIPENFIRKQLGEIPDDSANELLALAMEEKTKDLRGNTKLMQEAMDIITNRLVDTCKMNENVKEVNLIFIEPEKEIEEENTTKDTGFVNNTALLPAEPVM